MIGKRQVELPPVWICSTSSLTNPFLNASLLLLVITKATQQNMARVIAGLAVLASLTAVTNAWIPTTAPSFLQSTVAGRRSTARTTARTTTALPMALDYNNPLVAEEFNKVQPLTFEEVEEELKEKGIPVSQAMNEMDVKLMLVEVRLRFSGKLNDNNKQKKKPSKFSSKFEEAMWTKPVFEEFYNELKRKDDHNAMNVVAEYLNDKEVALKRYGKDYKAVLRQAEQALTAPPPVKSPKLKFSGFPANMGEAGCKMTLESLGTVLEFDCQQDEDFPVLKGTVTYEDIESAKKAVAQYNGMDMGVGVSLELTSV